MTTQEVERRAPNPDGYNGRHYSQAEIDAQAMEALRLKVAGWSDQQIGEHFVPPITRQTVAKRIKHAIATHGQATVAEYREIGKQRYEALIRKADEVGRDNPLEAIRVVADLNQKLMKLVGAEAPVQVEMEVHQISEQEKELREMLAQAERDEKARETVIIEGEAERV